MQSQNGPMFALHNAGSQAPLQAAAYVLNGLFSANALFFWMGS